MPAFMSRGVASCRNARSSSKVITLTRPSRRQGRCLRESRGGRATPSQRRCFDGIGSRRAVVGERVGGQAVIVGHARSCYTGVGPGGDLESNWYMRGRRSIDANHGRGNCVAGSRSQRRCSVHRRYRRSDCNRRRCARGAGAQGHFLRTLPRVGTVLDAEVGADQTYDGPEHRGQKPERLGPVRELVEEEQHDEKPDCDRSDAQGHHAANRTTTSAICVQARSAPACCVPAADCSNTTVDLKATSLLVAGSRPETRVPSLKQLSHGTTASASYLPPSSPQAFCSAPRWNAASLLSPSILPCFSHEPAIRAQGNEFPMNSRWLQGPSSPGLGW